MDKKIFDRSNYKLTAVVGGILILLVVSIGISFFYALYESQLSARKEFLNKQTELAARGLEFELSRFQEESRIFLNYLENTSWDQNKINQDLPLAARRTFIAFPSIIDTIWVDLGDLKMQYTLTARNDFVQSTVNQIPTSKAGKYQVIEGKSGEKIVYSFDLLGFASEYVSNFYQTPGGSKYLLFDDQLFDIGAASRVTERKIQASDLQRIREDISLGLKGFYQINWDEDGEADIDGVLAQYPFRFGYGDIPASLAFSAPVQSLTSGLYSTYFYLFIGIVFLLVGSILFFVISIKNSLEISKNKEATLLEISELFEQQNLLLKELRGFVFFHNYKGEISRISEEVEEVLGHPKISFLTAFQEGSKHPAALQVKEEILKAIGEKKEYVNLETDVIRADRKKIRLKIFEKLMYDDLGRFNGGMGICTDITEQYQSEMEIIESENRLRSLINNLPDVIFIYDNEGKVLDFHVQGRENLIETASQTLGKKLEEFVPHDQLHEILSAFQQARKTGKIQTINSVWKDEKEGVRHYEMRFFPLDQSQMISIAKDITSQKIWENGLMEAMNAADMASKAKSEFLANMSHEIRTPMNGLLGIIDLLESTNLNKIQKQYVDIIKNSGNSLLTIIRDILDYSKIESGKIEIHTSAFNPTVELKSQVEMLMGIAKKKEIILDLKVDPKAEVILEGDKGKINQVLLNLIGNALKFTPEKGKVSVQLDLEEFSEELVYLHYVVEDTGIGISEEHVRHLTEPFYQVESSNTRAYQGTGLGLAIAKKVAELLGGELVIRSQLGKGSVFGFSVLLKRSTESYLKPSSQDLTWRDIKEMGAVFPLRILLAEDNELNLQLMRLMFQQLGFAFEVATNGQEAYDMVKSKEFDVVLMDVQMPVMNGLEATIAIRALPDRKDLIIIGLSANVFEEDQQKALDIGMDDYLTKPIRLAVLADKLEYYFRKVRAKSIT